MIYVTVGTDHHSFDRLLREVYKACAENELTGELVVQHGYSSPLDGVECYKVVPFKQQLDFIKESRIVITHASSTAMLAVSFGKIPVIVARRAIYKEAVDDHQVEFLEEVGEVLPFIILDDVKEVGNVLSRYAALAEQVKTRSLEQTGESKGAVSILDDVVESWFGH